MSHSLLGEPAPNPQLAYLLVFKSHTPIRAGLFKWFLGRSQKTDNMLAERRGAGDYLECTPAWRGALRRRWKARWKRRWNEESSKFYLLRGSGAAPRIPLLLFPRLATATVLLLADLWLKPRHGILSTALFSDASFDLVVDVLHSRDTLKLFSTFFTQRIEVPT